MLYNVKLYNVKLHNIKLYIVKLDGIKLYNVKWRKQLAVVINEWGMRSVTSNTMSILSLDVTAAKNHAWVRIQIKCHMVFDFKGKGCLLIPMYIQ